MATFRNRELVRVKCMNFSGFVISVLEAFDQKVVDEIELALFPPATPAQTKDAYADAVTLFERAGIPAEDAILSALKAELAKPEEKPS